jgi:hypothetical protein
VSLAGTDIDGTVATVTVTSLPPASEGRPLSCPDGTTPVVAGTPITAAQAASLIFTPAANFNGTVTIAFTVTDDDGGVKRARQRGDHGHAGERRPDRGREQLYNCRGHRPSAATS